MNPAASKMASIEGARAIAAFLVLLLHAADFMRVDKFSGHIGLGGVFNFGYVGVDFFFVLSGFIITYVHFADMGRVASIPRYLWRRFSRIYPIYWIILAFVIVVVTVSRVGTGNGPGWEIGPSDVAGTIFLLVGNAEPKYIGVAWSLQFEILFYMAFCALLVNRKFGTIIFVIWGIIVLVRTIDWIRIDLPLGLGSPYCIEFLMGVAVGVSARSFRLHASPKWLVAALVGLALAVTFEMFGPFGRHSPAGRLALGVASAATLGALVATERSGAIRTPKWLAQMGSASYSIYLGHSLFINLTYVALLKLSLYHSLPEVIAFLMAVIVALTATMLIGFRIELPVVRALKGVWQTGPAQMRST